MHVYHQIHHNGSHPSVNISKNKQIFIIIRILFLFHKNLSALGSNQLVKTSMAWKLVLEPEHRVVIG